MRDLNRIHLLGQLEGNPTLRYTPGGLAVLELALVGKPKGMDPWHHWVKLLGPEAEALADALGPGQSLFVEARLDYYTWIDENGERKDRISLLADLILPLESALTPLNRAIVSGKLTEDPDLRYTPQADPVLRLNLKVESGKKVCLLEAEARAPLAEELSDLRTGEAILAIGPLLRTKNGDRNHAVRLRIDRAFRSRNPSPPSKEEFPEELPL